MYNKMKLGIATAAVVAVGAVPAQAGTYLCVPANAGMPVTSGGTSSGNCATGTTQVQMPTSAADQQTLIDLAQYVTVNQNGLNGKPTVTFSGANVQIVNGTGSTSSSNGKGNLIVGYDENNYQQQQTGSHSVVIGVNNGWTGYGDLVAGYNELAGASYATAIGYYGSAQALGSVSLGGFQNRATGTYSVASGGYSSMAQAIYGTVLGGLGNQANGDYSVAVGGLSNRAGARYSVAAGGCANLAGPGTMNSQDYCPNDDQSSYNQPGDVAAVFGGKFGHATQTLSTAVGGNHQETGGKWSVASGNVRWIRLKTDGTIKSSGEPNSDWQVVDGPGYFMLKNKNQDLRACSVSGGPYGLAAGTSFERYGDDYYGWLLVQTDAPGKWNDVDLDLMFTC